VDIFSAGILYYELFVPQLNGRRVKVNQLSRSIREGMQKFDQWEEELDLDTVLDETNILDDWRGCLSVFEANGKTKGK
jgi:hypothetical protein